MLIALSSAAANQAIIFTITDTRFYVPTVTLSTQDNGSCHSNWNQVLKEQFTEININQK